MLVIDGWAKNAPGRHARQSSGMREAGEMNFGVTGVALLKAAPSKHASTIQR